MTAKQPKIDVHSDLVFPTKVEGWPHYKLRFCEGVKVLPHGPQLAQLLTEKLYGTEERQADSQVPEYVRADPNLQGYIMH